jgi:hypothetical protein
VKGDQYVGSTHELGMHATDRRSHVNDIHATMLWALGLDHLGVTYMHKWSRRTANRRGGTSRQGSLRLIA